MESCPSFLKSDMFSEDTTLLSGLYGGALIGVAAAILLLFDGVVMGASGIVSTTTLHLKKAASEPSQLWKLVFLSTFLLSTTFWFAQDFDFAYTTRRASVWGNALAGLFVGFGTKLGNGCTSGHGICGLGRLSKRSFAAVMTFLSVALLTTYLTGPDNAIDGMGQFFQFLRIDEYEPGEQERLGTFPSALSAVSLATTVLALLASSSKVERVDLAKLGPAAVAGVLFAKGLLVSGMVYAAKVFGFLQVENIPKGTWDPTLAMVMGGGVVVSFVSYQFVNGYQAFQQPVKLECPLVKGSQFSLPSRQGQVDKELIVGAVCFGIGWGIGGVCPGPAMFQAGVGLASAIYYWWPCYFLGAFSAEKLKEFNRSRAGYSRV